MEFNELDSLRAAIKATPNNVPLRKLYINALTKAERYEKRRAHNNTSPPSAHMLADL